MLRDHPIFLESIKFIKSNLSKNNFSYLENKVLERLIHTSGDFTIEHLLEFSENACEKTIKSLQEGAPIITDTDMAAAAIKSMAQNTSRNKVFSAKKWTKGFDNKGTTKLAVSSDIPWGTGQHYEFEIDDIINDQGQALYELLVKLVGEMV